MAVTPVELAFLGGSTGTGELLVLFAVVLMLFGPRRLPEMARLIGRALQELRRAAQDFRDQVMEIDPPGAPPGADPANRRLIPPATALPRAQTTPGGASAAAPPEQTPPIPPPHVDASV